MSEPIITSLLDTDLYKCSMHQAILHLYPDAQAKFVFRCRHQENLTALLPQLKEQIALLADLSLTQEELTFLSQQKHLKSDYVHFMRLFRFDPDYVTLSVEQGQLCIEVQGPWLHVTHFEIFILAIVSELYARCYAADDSLPQGRARLQEKIHYLKQEHQKDSLEGFQFSDFGTRRRFSKVWQEEVLITLAQELPDFFVGTSNMDLARRLNLPTVGTMAHEWMQAHQALGPRLIDSQKAGMEAWVREYRGLLGIALTDVINMDAFVKDCDLYFGKLYDGLRHDSGDPFIWGERAIALYESMGIDPQTKKLMFSDSLTFEKAVSLYRYFYHRIPIAFGIGTYLTHDLGHKPLNIVMKMVECNGQPVAKISDTQGKTICQDERYIRYLKQVFHIEES